MPRKSKTHANFGRRSPQPLKTAQNRLAPNPAPEVRSQMTRLAQVEGDDNNSHLQSSLNKLAQAQSLVQLGLRLRDDIVTSMSDTSHGKTASVDLTKLAMARDAIDQLTNLVGELQSAHKESVKVAGALAGAVKLAQDGAIDVEDVFDVARESILNGSVKIAAVNEIYDQSPGELIEDGSASKQASPARSGNQDRLDPLTGYLRTVR